MSKIADLAYDIEQLYIDGMSAKTIAFTLECPIEMVLGCLEEMGVEDSVANVGEAVFASMVTSFSADTSNAGVDYYVA
jgi:hypothetical protein